MIQVLGKHILNEKAEFLAQEKSKVFPILFLLHGFRMSLHVRALAGILHQILSQCQLDNPRVDH